MFPIQNNQSYDLAPPFLTQQAVQKPVIVTVTESPPSTPVGEILPEDNFSRIEVEELLQRYCDDVDRKMEQFMKEFKCEKCTAVPVAPAATAAPATNTFFSTMITALMPVVAMTGAHLLLGVMRPTPQPQRLQMQQMQQMQQIPMQQVRSSQQSLPQQSISPSQQEGNAISGVTSSSPIL